jgi:hypothetical protein
MPILDISGVLHVRVRRLAALIALALPAVAGLLATAAPAHASTTPAQTGTAAHAGVISAAELSPQVAVKGAGVRARQQALAASWTPARMRAALFAAAGFAGQARASWQGAPVSGFAASAAGSAATTPTDSSTAEDPVAATMPDVEILCTYEVWRVQPGVGSALVADPCYGGG